MENGTYVETVQRDGWKDVFLTVVATSPISDKASTRDFFDKVATVAAKNGISILQEKIYGVCADKEMILAARSHLFERHGLDLETPLTFIEGAPCIGGLLAGVQIVGVVPQGSTVRVETIHDQGAPVGRELHLPGHRMLFFSGVSGFEPGSDLSVTEQAQKMFDHARSLLEARGLGPKHIVRTWIYMARLLDWYGEFNRVRTKCYRRFGIIGENGKGVLPASTGIQGKRTEGEECFMDVLAVVSDNHERPKATPMHNARQNEAYDYGSSFSRGMVVSIDERPTFWLSGTASINDQGRTVHHGNEQNQVLETMLNVAALLDGQNARLRDICQATAFCKNDRDYRVFDRIVDHLDMKDIPFVPVFADVCRDELLFEIDSVAVQNDAKDRQEHAS